MSRFPIACTLLLAAANIMPGLAMAQASSKTVGVDAAFRNVERIETELRRAVSTREDVRRLLGDPTGNGGALFPAARKSQEVWSYENVEMRVIGSSGGTLRVVQTRQSWDAILIFFNGDLFDGFVWFTSSPEGQKRANP